jgi:hypothetical protein
VGCTCFETCIVISLVMSVKIIRMRKDRIMMKMRVAVMQLMILYTG